MTLRLGRGAPEEPDAQLRIELPEGGSYVDIPLGGVSFDVEKCTVQTPGLFSGPN